jgi:hypothetical protein
MRAGFRVGAATVRGRLFDAFWSGLRRALPDALACHFWLGTDVMDTVREARSGRLRSAALLSARDDLHLAVAPWLTSELNGVGLRALTTLLPPAHEGPSTAPPLPVDFGVLTYAPTERFGFYGGNAVLEASRRMPEIRFDILGGRGQATRSEANVHWHGWVDDVGRMFANATVVVRVPQHDGYGNTVLEGLLYARHVVYTQEVPFTRRVWPVTANALVAVLEELRDAHSAGQLQANIEGRAYVREEFQSAKLLDRLIALIETSAAAGTG